MDRKRSGLLFALLSYLIWGVNPLYWKMLRHLNGVEITLHRVIWSGVFLVAVLAWRRKLPVFISMIRSTRLVALLLLNSVFLGINWGVYVWAVNSGKIVESSLGYFILPLFTLALGALLFREPLSRKQWAAVSLAAAGVVLMIIRTGSAPWIALILATSFAIYAAIRKSMHSSETLPTSAWEVVLLSGPAALLLFSTASLDSYSTRDALLLIFSGVVTATPLVLYMEATKRLPLSTVGFTQYLSPSIQFLLGVFFFDEPFGSEQAIAFGCIWLALTLYSIDILKRSNPASETLQ